jgi:ring-1,2-phenylacetyl-CoA epoxidase subunit PaaA
MTAITPEPVKSVAEFAAAPAEFQDAIRKIVRSHSINELYGAQVFDEPAIAFAPTPYAKWLTCRVAMEEYGHHVRFRELGEQIGVPAAQLVPGEKKPLSIFGFPLKSWEEFCVIKLLADLAEILQVEDLLHCSFHPLRNLARMTMPEERFHAQFGKDFCVELCRTQEGRKCRTPSTVISRCCRRSSGPADRRTTRRSAALASSSVATRRCAPISLSAPARWWKMS